MKTLINKISTIKTVNYDNLAIIAGAVFIVGLTIIVALNGHVVNTW